MLCGLLKSGRLRCLFGSAAVLPLGIAQGLVLQWEGGKESWNHCLINYNPCQIVTLESKVLEYKRIFLSFCCPLPCT
jgi:hypothetical protein